MTTAIPAPAGRTVASVPDDAYVLPEPLTETAGDRGPRFAEDIWDLRPFLPRSMNHPRITFTDIDDSVTALTLKEYLYSRLRRGTVPRSQGTAAAGR